MLKLIAAKKLFKLLKTLPVLGASVLLTSCGVPTTPFDTNSTTSGFNAGLISSINDFLMNGNPKNNLKNTTTLSKKESIQDSFYKFDIFTKANPNANNILYNQPFCNQSTSKRGNNSILNQVCTSKTVWTGKKYQYTFDYKKIIALYVNPIVHLQKIDIPKIGDTGTAQEMVNKVPIDGSKNNTFNIDSKPKANFDFSKVFTDKLTNNKDYPNSVMNGTFIVQGLDGSRIDINFFIGINPTNKKLNSYDLFLLPTNTWLVTNPK